MRKIVAASIAFSIAALFASSEASAQITSGFGFGTGLSQARAGIGSGFPFPGFARFGGARREGLPYFAKFPPVYYSGIVRRPYGISPFAAPSGIRPVELDVAPVRHHAVKIINPYATGSKKASKAKVEKKAEPNQSTKVVAPKRMVNPFFDRGIESQGITRHASYEEVEVH